MPRELLEIHRAGQRAEPLRQHLRAHELHHDVRRSVVEHAAIEDRGDVRNADRRQRVGLAQQRLPRRRVVRARDLDGDELLVRHALGEKHRAEAALPQRLLHAQLRQRRGRDDERHRLVLTGRRCRRRRSVRGTDRRRVANAPAAGGATNHRNTYPIGGRGMTAKPDPRSVKGANVGVSPTSSPGRTAGSPRQTHRRTGGRA